MYIMSVCLYRCRCLVRRRSSSISPFSSICCRLTRRTAWVTSSGRTLIGLWRRRPWSMDGRTQRGCRWTPRGDSIGPFSQWPTASETANASVTRLRRLMPIWTWVHCLLPSEGDSSQSKEATPIKRCLQQQQPLLRRLHLHLLCHLRCLLLLDRSCLGSDSCLVPHRSLTLLFHLLHRQMRLSYLATRHHPCLLRPPRLTTSTVQAELMCAQFACRSNRRPFQRRGWRNCSGVKFRRVRSLERKMSGWL